MYVIGLGAYRRIFQYKCGSSALLIIEVENIVVDYRKRNIRITTNIQETKDEKNTINFNVVCS